MSFTERDMRPDFKLEGSDFLLILPVGYDWILPVWGNRNMKSGNRGARRRAGDGCPRFGRESAKRDNLNVSAWVALLTRSLAENDSRQVMLALKQILKEQNISAIARSAGMRRDTLYRSFSGPVDPNLGRVLKLLAALNIRLVAKEVRAVNHSRANPPSEPPLDSL
jgi:probable addiction module antidote protein